MKFIKDYRQRDGWEELSQELKQASKTMENDQHRTDSDYGIIYALTYFLLNTREIKKY